MGRVPPGREQLPDQAGTELGRGAADILGTRPGDLDGADVRAMREVVDTVRDQRSSTFDTKPGDDPWRYRLMNPGHEPLRPLGTA